MTDAHGSALLDDRLVLEIPGTALAGADWWSPAGRPADEVGVRLELGSRTPVVMLARTGDVWRVEIARPAVDRIEYVVMARAGDGVVLRGPDPANPRQVIGPGGARSELLAAAYTVPAWTGMPVARPGSVRGCAVPDVPASLRLWCPDGTPDDLPLPLLVVHDGSDYERYGRLLQLCSLRIASRQVPVHRVLLVDATDRLAHFGADRDYALALGRRILPAVAQVVATRDRPVLLGASLGAVAALHAVGTGAVDAAGLLAQSGSFLRADLDAHETWLPCFGAVASFVQQLPSDADWARGRSLTFTCGTGEENRGNNRVLVQRLRAAGIDATYAEVADAHTWTGWRDALDPAVPDLLRRCWL